MWREVREPQPPEPAEVSSYGRRVPEVQGVRPDVSARGALRLRALLRAARGRLRPLELGDDRRRAAPPHPGRARRTSGATPTSCRSRRRPGRPRASSRVGLPAGCTPLIRADRLAERLGLREVWVKNDAANPTHSFKDRVVAVALAAGARARLRRRSRAPRPATSPTRSPPRPRRSGCESYVFIPADLEEQKILATGVYGTHLVKVTGNYDDVNRLCTELSGEHESWAFVNVNMRPYYAEGSKTLAYEIAEQLGWETARPRRRADRLRLAVHEDRQGLRASGSSSGCIDGRPADDERRAGRGLLAGRAAPSRPAHDVCRPVKPDTIAKSLAIGNPADGPYALELARAAAAASTPSPTTRSATASGCSPRRPASSPRPPAA